MRHGVGGGGVEAAGGVEHGGGVEAAAGGSLGGGGQLVQPSRDSTALQRLGGMGQWVAGELSRICDHEMRVTVLGHLQRGGSPSPFDRILATRFGAAAVRLIATGSVGQMVALHATRIVAVPLADAIREQRTIPLDSDLILTARGLGVSLGESSSIFR